MAVIAVLGKRKTGQTHQRRAFTETATGPAANVTVAAGGTADVVINVAGPVARAAEELAVKSITGLPAGLYISNITVDAANKTITLSVVNPGTSDITVSADSIALEVIGIV